MKVRCVDCEFLAGSERTPQWIFASACGFCDHPERAGGRWNVLQDIKNPSNCGRFKQAEEWRVKQRVKALEILSKRKEK